MTASFIVVLASFKSTQFCLSLVENMATKGISTQLNDENTTDGNTIIDSFIQENRFHAENKSFKCNFKHIKWIPVMTLLFVSTFIPGIVILNKEKSNQVVDLDYKLGMQKENETVCVFIKQYDIYHDTYVTVCNRYGVVVLDIRKFVNNTPSATGIQLSERQWLRLKQVSSLVDTSIAEARTYWRDLKVLKYEHEN